MNSDYKLVVRRSAELQNNSPQGAQRGTELFWEVVCCCVQGSLTICSIVEGESDHALFALCRGFRFALCFWLLAILNFRKIRAGIQSGHDRQEHCTMHGFL